MSFVEERYTSDWYFSNNENWHEEDAAFKANEVIKILTKNKINPLSIADVGCGTGEVLNLLSQDSYFSDNTFFEGYEIAHIAYERAKMKQSKQLLFYNTQMPAFKQYDLILLLDVIEHIPDYWSLLNELKQSSSYLLLHIPLDLSLYSLYKEPLLIEQLQTVGHIHFFTKKLVQENLALCGLKIIDYHYTPPSDMLQPNQKLKLKIKNKLKKMAFQLNNDWAVKWLGGYSMMVLCQKIN